METSTVTAIDADAIREWVQSHLAPLCPDGAKALVINRHWHCKGESAFFAAVDVEEPITIDQLRRLVVTEHTREHYLHFYVVDVIAAAVGSGAFPCHCTNMASFFLRSMTAPSVRGASLKVTQFHLPKCGRPSLGISLLSQRP